jgi:hypothetical protein
MLAMADALASVIGKNRIRIAMMCITVIIIFIILLQNAQVVRGEKYIARYPWIVMRKTLCHGHALAARRVDIIKLRRYLAEDAISKLKRKYFENMFFI